MNELAGRELEHFTPHDLRRTCETGLAMLERLNQLFTALLTISQAEVWLGFITCMTIEMRKQKHCKSGQTV